MRILPILILLFVSFSYSAQAQMHHHGDGKMHHHDAPANTTMNHDSMPSLTIMSIDGPVPWTSLDLNNNPKNFQFAIVTDRTGGHRPGVFMDAINKLNLLQPEFVMSVGDLIEGYTEDIDELNRQWDEFDSFVQQLDMPFFYLPGNHDITNQTMEDLWKKRLGPTYYHFVYNNVLFLALNSEDQKKGAGKGTISDEQYEYIQKVLAENKDVDWTLVFMHQPLWTQKSPERWYDVENLLKDRKHTVYTGHVHRYTKYVRNKRNYFTLATTGGASGLRGPSMGEFDHVVWITMTEQGPIMANLLLEGIWDENVLDENMRDFISNMGRKTPFSTTPIYTNQDFGKGEMTIKVTNDENIPMHVVFKEEFSKDIVGILSKKEIEVEPNSVEKIQLELLKRKELADEPMTLKAEVSYKGDESASKIKLPYQFNIKPLQKYALTKVKKAKKIDGKSKDWQKFNYHFLADDGGDAKVAFDVAYDDEYFYFAAQVMDDTLVSTGKGAPWSQDNIAFGVNPLPAHLSAMSTGRDWYSSEIFQMMTPATADAESVLYRNMPEGFEMKCVATDYGYFAEAKLPLKHIEEKQGKNWKTLRIQVALDDKDGENTNRYWWQPDWMSKENVVGSGMFFRE